MLELEKDWSLIERLCSSEVEAISFLDGQALNGPGGFFFG